MKVEKALYKYAFYYAIIVSIIIIIIESLIKKSFSTNYAVCFCEGVIINVFCFYLTAKSIDYIINNSESKAKRLFVFINLVKLLIYGAVMYLSFRIYKYGIFSCVFGLLTIKILIYLKYLILDSYHDKKMLIEELELSQLIINKLKTHNIKKVIELRQNSKDDLLEYLTNEEVNDIVKSLHEHEYFLKNELEVIVENEDDVDS